MQTRTPLVCAGRGDRGAAPSLRLCRVESPRRSDACCDAKRECRMPAGRSLLNTATGVGSVFSTLWLSAASVFAAVAGAVPGSVSTTTNPPQIPGNSAEWRRGLQAALAPGGRLPLPLELRWCHPPATAATPVEVPNTTPAIPARCRVSPSEKLWVDLRVFVMPGSGTKSVG